MCGRADDMIATGNEKNIAITRHARQPVPDRTHVGNDKMRLETATAQHGFGLTLETLGACPPAGARPRRSIDNTPDPQTAGRPTRSQAPGRKHALSFLL